MDFNIRLASSDDAIKLTELRLKQQRDDWGLEYCDYDGKFKERTLRFFKSLDINNCLIFVADLDNKIIATCGVQFVSMLPQCNDNGNYGYIFNVYTLDEYRGNGAQSKLFKFVLNYLKDIGLPEISLETDNEVAINLYKKYGFEFNSMVMTRSL